MKCVTSWARWFILYSSARDRKRSSSSELLSAIIPSIHCQLNGETYQGQVLYVLVECTYSTCISTVGGSGCQCVCFHLLSVVRIIHCSEMGAFCILM